MLPRIWLAVSAARLESFISRFWEKRPSYSLLAVLAEEGRAAGNRRSPTSGSMTEPELERSKPLLNVRGWTATAKMRASPPKSLHSIVTRAPRGEKRRPLKSPTAVGYPFSRIASSLVGEPPGGAWTAVLATQRAVLDSLPKPLNTKGSVYLELLPRYQVAFRARMMFVE